MIKAIYFPRKNNNNSLRKKIWENEGVQIENMAEHFVVKVCESKVKGMESAGWPFQSFDAGASGFPTKVIKEN